MPDAHLLKKWKTIEALLAASRKHLALAAAGQGDRLGAELRRFEDYMQHNELELALEELVAVGAEYRCRGDFWRELERAAIVMELHERAAQLRAAFTASLRDRNDA